MAYSTEIITRSKARLAQQRADKESLALRRQSEVYAKLPRIREIDLELRRTMVQAAQAAFTAGGDTSLLEEARAHNRELQQEREALLKEHFPENFLDESPVCPSCGGTGYLGSTMCRCLSDLCREEQQKDISVLSCGSNNFARFRTDVYPSKVDPRLGSSPRDLMQVNLDYARQFAYRFTPDCGNLLFVGGTGLGKTFLSSCIAKTVSDRGYGVVYESAGKLFSVLENAKFNANEETLRAAAKYTDCDLLILDDLGTEMPGQFVTAALYALINERMLSRKSTIISTNLLMAELTKRYNPQIASRLQGEYHMLTFMGEDIRILKNRGAV